MNPPLLNFAGEQGFEPQLKASKASVLPLDDSPIGYGHTLAQRARSSQIKNPMQNTGFLDFLTIHYFNNRCNFCINCFSASELE